MIRMQREIHLDRALKSWRDSSRQELLCADTLREYFEIPAHVEHAVLVFTREQPDGEEWYRVKPERICDYGTLRFDNLTVEVSDDLPVKRVAHSSYGAWDKLLLRAYHSLEIRIAAEQSRETYKRDTLRANLSDPVYVSFEYA